MTWLNWPNRITIARILLIPALVICLLNLNKNWAHWRHVALGLVALMAFSDFLDGYLARRRNEATALGQFLDPLADKLLIASTVILLSIEASGVPGFLLPSWVPVIALTKDIILLLGFGLIYVATNRIFVEPKILGKSCTVVQLVMVAFCLAAPDLAPFLQRGWVVVYWIASGLAIVAVVDYVRTGNRFASAQLHTSD